MSSRITLAAALVAAAAVVVAATVQAANFGAWGAALKLDEIGGNHADVNTAFLDGCPIASPDGKSLFIASNRPGGLGGLDIWVSRRESRDDPWGAPVNLGEPVNSAADDFCPTPVRGRGLFFVSREPLPGACGQGDIYFTKHNARGVYREPERLACAPAGPNTIYDEQGPSFVEVGGQGYLFFSTSSVSPAVPGDIYRSVEIADGVFGPASPVVELSSAGNDIQPNVRNDGLEIVFSSNHAHAGAQGAQDLYSAKRARFTDPWSPPVNLGTNVNTAASETRPSLSWDAQVLLFGRAPGPEGMSDIYQSTRQPGGGG